MMMNLKLKHIIVLSLLILAGEPLFAQVDDSQENPVILYSGTSKRYEIADIIVTGMEENNHKSLISLSGLSVGSRVAVPGPDITEAMKRLWRTGLFANVQILARKIQGDKIWLEMAIEQNPKIKEVVFHGIRKGEASELEDKIAMYPGSQITQNALDRSAKLIRDYFDEKGFKDADVRVQQRSEPDEDGLAYVDVYIDKREKVKVRTIHLEGNDALSDKTLKRVMKKTNEKGKLSEFFHTKKFVRDEYLNDKDNILAKYSELGYRDAVIVYDSVASNIEDNMVDIWLKLEEGDKYYIRSVNWVGNTVYNSEQLSTMLGMKRGDVYNQKKIAQRTKDDDDAIGKMYYNNGYVMLQLNIVEAHVEGSGDGRIVVVDGNIVTATARPDHAQRTVLRASFIFSQPILGKPLRIPNGEYRIRLINTIIRAGAPVVGLDLQQRVSSVVVISVVGRFRPRRSRGERRILGMRPDAVEVVERSLIFQVLTLGTDGNLNVVRHLEAGHTVAAVDDVIIRAVDGEATRLLVVRKDVLPFAAGATAP